MESRKTVSFEGFLLAALLISLTVLSGCAAPIGVEKISPQQSYNNDTKNALGDEKISDSSKTVLQRHNLLDLLEKSPEYAVRGLEKISEGDGRRDLLFALSELHYLYGGKIKGESESSRQQALDAFLQAATYAYFYLLGDGTEPPPTAYDVRFREACDLYNRSLAQAFPSNPDGSLNLDGGVRHLPSGDLNVALTLKSRAWQYDDFQSFYPANDYAVKGFTVRNRTSGLGMPLVCLTVKSERSPNGGALPITAFLKISGSYADFRQGKSQAFLELYSAFDDVEVKVNDRSIPLETDTTTPLAYKLNEAHLWRIGEKRFLTGAKVDIPVILIQPYEKGRIPVIFVHGTASSPHWWAEMFNSLRADPEIRKKFQFWFFQYNSSNMITMSAWELREAITNMIERLDPQREDPALQQMVVIGHSQGGLLTKMTAIDSGDRLWNAISDQPFDKAELEPKMRDLAQRLVFIKPVQSVRRVVFISTPHRGSFLSRDWVRSLIRRVVTLPYNVVTGSHEFLDTMWNRLKFPEELQGQIPTSIDGMSSTNPVLKSLVSIPLAPGIVGHSIIAVKPGMDIETGNDGVVEYKSAHIEGVESEYLVSAGHSCQDHPLVVEEVRRILLKHVRKHNDTQTTTDS